MKLEDISRAVSHALRHEPWLYELELDAEGWAEVDSVLDALRDQREEWRLLTAADLARMIETSAKQRHEMRNGRIRALYGHSIPGRLQKTAAEPPEVLYHGTAPSAVPANQASGLLPMRRQFVHLSVDTAMAREVGRRKSPQPTILRILAREAHQAGIPFYVGNEHVWLADAIPAQYISGDHAS